MIIKHNFYLLTVDFCSAAGKQSALAAEDLWESKMT